MDPVWTGVLVAAAVWIPIYVAVIGFLVWLHRRERRLYGRGASGD